MLIAKFLWSRLKTIRSPWDFAQRLGRLFRLLFDFVRGRYGKCPADCSAFIDDMWLRESPVFCVLCGQESPAFVERSSPDPALLCPKCGSIGRWRVFGRYFDDNAAWLADISAAIEISYSPGIHECLVQRIGTRLKVIDVEPLEHVDLVADCTRLPFLEDSLDLILHSHVLEHVQDDIQALREMYRVLRPGGRVVFNVPFDNVLKVGVVSPDSIGAAPYHGAGEERNRVRRCYSIDGLRKTIMRSAPFAVRELAYDGLAYHRIPYSARTFKELLWELSKPMTRLAPR